MSFFKLAHNEEGITHKYLLFSKVFVMYSFHLFVLKELLIDYFSLFEFVMCFAVHEFRCAPFVFAVGKTGAY